MFYVKKVQAVVYTFLIFKIIKFSGQFEDIWKNIKVYYTPIVY